MFRRGVRQSLEEAGIEVVGEASNGISAVRLISELRPDVVVMDLHMPQMGGVEAVRAVLDSGRPVRILMLTISTEDDDVIDALSAGAVGYVIKTAPPEEVVRAVRAAHEGDSTVSPKVAGRLLARLRDSPPRPPAPAAAPSLTARELEILRLIVDGKENREIADILVISPSTAKNHVASVLDKLGMDNRVQAAVYAVRAGIV